MQESQVQSLGGEDPLEKDMAAFSSILAWEIQDRGTWHAAVHGVEKSLLDLTKQHLACLVSTDVFYSLEK